ncbi:hypothetical protein HPB52_018711 [Rhipicephalus sanguineus]|uniref:Uncharacterized protein n=1 Tax=Rhipicephalus sanguineus TaxID=34632 RepID=A0A9D4T6B3_RHISA|nr:hypothetical protein HPB52_018711 [Rhipicephalus sanguineus]
MGRDCCDMHLPLQEQWATYFSKYTEGSYMGSEHLDHYERSTTIIKKLFEDKEVGKVGLRYLVAWSIYRQLAKFTDPYLMRGYKKADEACFLLVKDVMRLAIVSHYFQKRDSGDLEERFWRCDLRGGGRTSSSQWRMLRNV